MNKSKLLNLNWKDFAKSIVVFLLTTVIAGLYQLTQTNQLFVWDSVKGVLMAALSATLAYLIKNLFTNSEDKIVTPEK